MTNASRHVYSLENICPYTHGQGVYIARSLLTTIDPFYNFVNDCETDPNFRPKTMHVTANEPQLHVFPNPAGDIVYFEMKNVQSNEQITIWITDAGGKTMMTKTMTMEQLNVLDVSGLAVGCYSLTIMLHHKQTFSEKICLIR